MTLEIGEDKETAGQNHRLRIGMVAPPWFHIPPKGYGGTEAVVASLVDQLVTRGHHVTLVASGEPGTGAQRFIQVYQDPPSHLLGTSVLPELIQAAEAQCALANSDLDIVHDHSAAGPLTSAGRPCPTVVTMHGPVAGDSGDYYRRLGNRINLVAISNAQRRIAPDLPWVGTVHNAVDVASYPFTPDKGDDILWIGRFNPDKGAHIAIEVARLARRRIVLAGKLNEPSERAYFDTAIRPLLGPDVDYIGEADATLKRELFAQASCLLFPIQWDEPFGMVMAEALACGTPVIATPRGSVPEIVRQGTTGFVCRSIEDLVTAVRAVHTIDPAACRADAQTRFDLPVMAAGYERVYHHVIGRARPTTRPLGAAA